MLDAKAKRITGVWLSLLLIVQTLAAFAGGRPAQAAGAPVAAGPLPAGWQAIAPYDTRDPSPVSVSFQDGKFSLSVDGGRIHTDGDEGLFVYLPLTGIKDKEFSFTARISEFVPQPANAWALLMVKSGLGLQDRMVGVGLDYNSGQTRIRDYRRLDTSGGGNTPVSGSTAYWVRLERKAKDADGVPNDLVFTYSTDGVTFSSRTSYNNDANGHYTHLNLDTLYVGFAMSAASAVIDQVVFTVDGVEVFNSEHAVFDPVPPAEAPVVTATAKNREVLLAWQTVTGATYYNVNYGTEDGGPYPLGVRQITDTQVTIDGLTNGTTYYFVVTAANPYGEGPPSAQVAATPVAPPKPGLYELGGFAQYTTGGGELDESDPGYFKVTNAVELKNALNAVVPRKVIEIMNDLDLGWHEIPEEARSAPFSRHNDPLTHPVLLETGVSKITVDGAENVTIFSANGAKIRHAGLVFRNSRNIIIRNLEFDELWEWDEATKGDYDRNDWDYISLESSENVWIDHCTFNKAYDGVVDLKGGTKGVTISWSLFRGDDGSPHSWVSRQIDALEALPGKYPMYRFLRETAGLSKEDIAAVSAGQKKGHLVGSAELSPDNAQLEITLHHNYYDDMMDRIPRLRGGNAHAYNIVIDSSGNLAAARRLSPEQAQRIAEAGYKFAVTSNGAISTEDGALLVENAVIRDVEYPVRNNQKDPGDDTFTGKIRVLDTRYSYGGTINYRGGSEDPGSPLAPRPAPAKPFSWNGMTELPYETHDLLDLDDLEARLLAPDGAGAAKLFWAKENWLKTRQYTGDPANAPTEPYEVPPVVGGLRATPGDGQVTLHWGSVNTADRYNVYRVTAAGAVKIGETAVPVYTDSGLANGETYEYYVRAVNAHGEGAPSKTVQVTPFRLEPPAAPAGVTLTGGATKLILTWQKPAHAEYYVIRRRAAGEAEFVTIAAEVYDTRYEDTTVKRGTVYEYTVSAVNRAGEGPASAPVTGQLTELRDESGLTLLFHDTFDQDETGQPPAGYEVVQDAGTVRVVEVPDAGNKSVELFDDRSGYTQIDKRFDRQTDLVVAEFRFMQPVKANSAKVLRLVTEAGVGKTANEVAAVAIETNGGNLAYRTQQGYIPLLNYSKDTWYTVKIAADLTRQKADVYIDGQLVLEQADLFNPVTEIAAIQSFTPNNNSAYRHYLDDIKVYGAGPDEPPAPAPNPGTPGTGGGGSGGSGSGGGGSGDGSGRSDPSGMEPVVETGDGGEVVLRLVPRVENGTAVATLTDAALEAALRAALEQAARADRTATIVLDVAAAPGAGAYEQRLPLGKLQAGTAGATVSIRTPAGAVNLPESFWQGLDAGGAAEIAIVVRTGDVSRLNETVRAAAVGRPAIELAVRAGDRPLDWHDPGAPVTVTIPYAPPEDDARETELIVVWFVGADGTPVPVPNGRYVKATGTVTFIVTRSGLYAVARASGDVADAAALPWAAHAIRVLAARGVVEVPEGGSYRPAEPMTRGEFAGMLVRALGLTAKAGGNFRDVKADAPYAEAIAIARQLGIVRGRGGDRFDPGAPITRQEAALLVHRALAARGLPVTKGTADDLAPFDDADRIAGYAADSVAALVKEGILRGDGRSLQPQQHLTRAAAAVLVYRLYGR